MKINPKTEEQILEEERIRLEALLFPKGQYAFEVRSAIEKVSTKGNEMIEIDLDVYDGAGNKRSVRDWILELFPLKLRHFARAAGLETEYNNGGIEAWQCEGATGQVMLDIEPAKGQYQAKNKVIDYVADTTASKPILKRDLPKETSSNLIDDIDDEIPF